MTELKEGRKVGVPIFGPDYCHGRTCEEKPALAGLEPASHAAAPQRHTLSAAQRFANIAARIRQRPAVPGVGGAF
jgi:hypothetical protein